ncbi:PCTP-like, partial [Cuculus canorus]
QALKKLHKGCLKYPTWKSHHNPTFKPWLFPEQNLLPTVPLSTLAVQRAESLENIDESSLAEAKEEGSDDD